MLPNIPTLSNSDVVRPVTPFRSITCPESAWVFHPPLLPIIAVQTASVRGPVTTVLFTALPGKYSQPSANPTVSVPSPVMVMVVVTPDVRMSTVVAAHAPIDA